jgi:hypothetical protein
VLLEIRKKAADSNNIAGSTTRLVPYLSVKAPTIGEAKTAARVIILTAVAASLCVHPLVRISGKTNSPKETIARFP